MANPRNLANIAPSINASSGNVQIGSSLNNVDSSTNVFQAVGSTATGNAFIGTSSAFSSGNGGGQLRFGKVDTGVLNAFGAIEGSPNDPTSGVNGYLAFKTSDGSKVLQERARFDHSGNWLIGTTSTSLASASTGTGVNYLANNALIVAANGGNNCFIANKTNSTTGSTIDFRYNGSSVGNVSITSSSTSYNTSSDYRLKNTIAPMTGALNKIAQLKPVTYKWNVDGSDGEGFIAHELAEVVPACVSGEKDATETYVDENGIEQTRPKYQGIDTSFLVATLTAAIQEQQTIIESLKARLDAANL